MRSLWNRRKLGWTFSKSVLVGDRTVIRILLLSNIWHSIHSIIPIISSAKIRVRGQWELTPVFCKIKMLPGKPPNSSTWDSTHVSLTGVWALLLIGIRKRRKIGLYRLLFWPLTVLVLRILMGEM